MIGSHLRAREPALFERLKEINLVPLAFSPTSPYWGFNCPNFNELIFKELLQVIIQVTRVWPPLPESEFHSVFSGVTGKNPKTHQELFNDFLLKINKALAYVQFELRGCRNQYDGMIYYGVVNNVADEQSKLGTRYSVPQIAFYKAVIEAIVQDISTHGCITNIEALNICLDNQVQAVQGSQNSQSHVPPSLKNFSISQKEKTLNALIQDQWLCSVSDGKIGLGIRSFLDLRSWFRSNSIPACDVCNEAGVKATTCSNGDCTVRMHDYCIKKKFSQRKAARVCPGCGTAWNLSGCNEDPEDVVVVEQTQVPSTNPPSGRRPRSCKQEAVEASQVQIQEPFGPVPRRRLRSHKQEAVETSQVQSQEPSGPVLRKRQRICKAEAVLDAEAGTSQPSVPSADVRRTRRSGRM
ncbi:hypothetical protein J5N97_017372 [Dioscorea zingiberensis]|uniref:Non-structural maintenance of chromosomes element 1 homolog n=1 Tax=Dioscorea zingiberensis TaxID=325984 RepID=A0A9D5HGI5_9LILI|nr:hypothetical protein J5N97_017372 [Dioscorea zingiberensis]